MDFHELVNKRHSTRGYLDKAVEHEKIERYLEAVRLAPPACNAPIASFRENRLYSGAMMEY